MKTLIEFLNDCLNRDEAAAREAGGDEWSADVNVWMVVDSKGEPVAYDEGKPTEEQAAHIALHDPARVLREVAAKRAILAEHPIRPADEPGDYSFGCERCYFNRDEGVYGSGYCRTLKSLAGVYSDHPDYRKDWAE